MGWAIERKNRFTAMYYDASGRALSAGTFATPKQAKHAWEEAEAKVRKGRRRGLKDEKLTLREYVYDHWGPAVKLSLEIRTWQGYESKLRIHVLPYLGDMPVGALRYSNIQGLLNERQSAGLSPASAKGVLRVIRLVTKAAVRDELLETDPSAPCKLRGVANSTGSECWTILDPALYSRFVTWLGTLDDRWRIMLLLNLDLGARFSEIRGLRAKHILTLHNHVVIEETIGEAPKKVLDERDDNDDWPHGQYRIGNTFFFKPTTKSNQRRRVEINADVMKEVSAYIQQRNLGPEDLLFTTDSGMPIGGSWFTRRIWKPFLQSNQLPDMRFHDIRHTVASWNDAAGLPLNKNMAHMGHGSIVTANLYVHSLRGKAAETASARDQLLGRTKAQ